MTAPAFCPYCGRQRPVENRFCGGCGREMPTLVEPGAVEPTALPVAPSPVMPAEDQVPRTAPSPAATPAPRVQPAPLAAPAHAPPQPARKASGSKAPLIVGGLAAVIVLAVAAVFFMGGGDEGGSSRDVLATPLGLTVEVNREYWKERNTRSGWVAVEDEADFDLRKPPKEGRVTITRSSEGNVDFGSALQGALGGKSPADASASFDVVEPPHYVRVGNTYGVSIGVWRKNTDDTTTVQRTVYVASKSGGYVFTAEAQAPSFYAYDPIFRRMLKDASISDPAFTGAPPAEGAVPGPGWPALFVDTFGPGHRGLPLGALESDGWSGSTKVEAGKYVVDANLTALVTTLIPERPPADSLDNGYLSVEVQNVSGTSALYGLRIRSFNKRSTNLLINDTTGTWRLDYMDAFGDRTNIIPQATSPVIRRGEKNKLALMVVGNHYTAWINGEKVGEVDYTPTARDSSPVNWVGLYYQSNVIGPFCLEWDNLEARAPE